MAVIEILAGSYLLFAIVVVAMVWAAIPGRSNRYLFFLVALLIPFLFIWALILLPFKRSSGPVYSCSLAKTEDLIEEERVRLFGGRATVPSVSERWRDVYARALNRAALNAEAFSTRLLRSFHAPVFGGTVKH
jgi:hypothetical protein